MIIIIWNHLKKELNEWSGLENLDLASLVSTSKAYQTSEGIWDIKNNKL